MAGLSLTMILAIIYALYGFIPALIFLGCIPVTVIQACRYLYDRRPY